MPTTILKTGKLQYNYSDQDMNKLHIMFRAQANMIARATGCKGTYSLMKLPEHDRLAQTVPDAMHTTKDLIEKLVHLVAGMYYNQIRAISPLSTKVT